MRGELQKQESSWPVSGGYAGVIYIEKQELGSLRALGFRYWSMRWLSLEDVKLQLKLAGLSLSPGMWVTGSPLGA